MNDVFIPHLIGISKDHRKLYTAEGVVIESENPFDMDALGVKLPEMEASHEKQSS